ncbi:hypothetical protein [Pseudocolwellia agarivorans]|uniref:hypothetical protein n=1 Tax=Pseudocolwellia agarivorans TaxID=1911682 RepID=UPI003F8830CF
MESNVYATPKSDIENTSINLTDVKVYSPTQIACGALVGGPIGLIYFLMTNFSLLNDDVGKRNVLYAGIAFIIALLFILPMLPDDFPNSPFTVAYVVVARLVAEKYQMTKKAIIESEQYQFQSSWKAFGICLLGSALVVLVPLLILDTLGFITL